jgi:hypothetical protein
MMLTHDLPTVPAGANRITWNAIGVDGNHYHQAEWRSLSNLPVAVKTLQAWVEEDKAGTLLEVDIPEGADPIALRRSLGSHADLGLGDANAYGDLSVAIGWRKGDQERWHWLFLDGTVAMSTHDPAHVEWGWEDFLRSVSAQVRG